MLPVIFSKALVAASANCICTSQSATGAQNLAINGSAASGGVATLDTQRRVLITSAGNDSAITFTVYGTNESGASIQQTITGSNAGTVATALDFLTVTRVATSGATGSTVTVGTNTTGSCPWRMPSYHVTPFEMNIFMIVSGTVTYNLESTIDDYFTPATPTNVPNVLENLQGQTTTYQGAISTPVRGWRITITSGTGTLTVEGLQAGIANY